MAEAATSRPSSVRRRALKARWGRLDVEARRVVADIQGEPIGARPIGGGADRSRTETRPSGDPDPPPEGIGHRAAPSAVLQVTTAGGRSTTMRGPAAVA